MRVGGWCLESAAEFTWNNFIPHLPESLGTSTFPLSADGLQTSGVLPGSAGAFPLIADGLQTFDVLPSSTGAFPLIADGLQTFEVLSRRSA
ncbi:hypothetical protein TNCV_565201 [Trichonephila clavipes]|nr:hypothetical protein TNCV_565201 [Trichonephila clavipes]